MTEKPSKKPRPSAFEVVTVAAARARQLVSGCVPKVEGSAKPARRALQEVTSGAIGRTEDKTGDR